MPRFAEGTKITEDTSLDEIRRTLKRYGAYNFAQGSDDHKAYLQCSFRDRQLRWIVKFPLPEECQKFPSGRKRSPDEVEAAVEAERRRRWRVALLIIKGAFEQIDALEGDDSQSIDWEDILLPHFLLPNGQTMSQVIREQAQAVFAEGKPLALPALGGTSR